MSPRQFLIALRKLALFLMPPRNLYERLIDVPLNPSIEQRIDDLQFAHCYVGLYEVGLVTRNAPPMVGSPSALALRISLTLSWHEGRYEQTVGKEVSPWWGSVDSGFKLLRYSVPENAPASKPVCCAIRIIATDDALNNNYGPIRLYIRKASEE